MFRFFDGSRSVTLVLLFCLLPLGCGGGGETDSTESGAADENVTSTEATGGETEKIAETPAVPVNPQIKVKSTSSSDIAEKENPPEFPENLAIGDVAPPIHLASFYTGEAVEKLEKGRIYVIEFWATWCPPCRTSMPHLSELQEMYADKVTMIGVTEESQAKVGPFLADAVTKGEDAIWADVVKYRLAQDKNGWTNKSYMQASKQRGIPTAFIVGAGGHIEWFGHPMTMDEPLAKIAAGKWDREVETKKMELQKELQKSMRGEDWEKALTTLDEIESLSPDDPTLPLLRFGTLSSAERFKEASALAEQSLKNDSPDAEHLNAYAYMVASEFPEEERDLELALQLAQKANALTDENAAPVLDTLAYVYSAREEYVKAVEWQEKAALYGDRESYEEKLAIYKDLRDRPEIPESLAIGDVAPELQTATWYLGEEIEGFDEGKIYVVEFWATCCGPCLSSMPHLSKLQEEYGDDVTFIGFTNEAADVVEPFLAKTARGQKLSWAEFLKYRLVEDRRGWTNESYMKASKQAGIPTAFVVGRDGKIEWIGHPMELDSPLEQVVSGDWDREAEMVAQAKQARVAAAMQSIRGPMMTARRDKDYEEMVKLLEGVEKELGEDADGLQTMKFSFLTAAEKYDDAITVAEDFVASEVGDARTLNRIAWTIATEFPEDHRDLDLGLDIAKRASTLEEDKNPQVIDTLSRVYFERGEFDAAIEWQQKAVEIGGDSFEKALEDYKAAKKQAEKASKQAEKSSDDEDAEDLDSSDEENTDDEKEPEDSGEAIIDV